MRALLIVTIVSLSLNALLQIILLMHAIITDDDAEYRSIPNILYSVALIMMFAQKLMEL